jgi:hypothetical protein
MRTQRGDRGPERKKIEMLLPTSNASSDWIACDYEGRTERLMSSPSQPQPKTSGNSP